MLDVGKLEDFMENGYLKDKKCYVSSPMEHASYDYEKELHQPCLELNKRFGIDVFNPHEDPKEKWLPDLKLAREQKDFDKMEVIARRFVKKDLSQVCFSHFLIAYAPYKVPTTGLTHEVINASNAKIPVIIVGNKGKELISFWFFGFVKHKMMFDNWDRLYEYLAEVDAGKHKDNDRWAMVYGLV